MNENLANLPLILAAITDGIVVVNAQGIVLYANQSAERIFERGDLTGRDLAVPLTAEGDFQNINLIRRSGIGWAELRSTPITWNGEAAHVIGVRDITEKYRAENALTLNRKLTQSIIDGSSALIYALDLDGCFTLVNKSLAALFCCDTEQLLGKTRAACMPENIAAQHRQNDLTELLAK